MMLAMRMMKMLGGVMMMLVMCVILGVRGWYLFLEQGHRPRHRGGCQNGPKAATVQSKGETGNAGRRRSPARWSKPEHCCSLNYSPDHSFGRSDGRCAPWSVQTCKAASWPRVRGKLVEGKPRGLQGRQLAEDCSQEVPLADHDEDAAIWYFASDR